MKRLLREISNRHELIFKSVLIIFSVAIITFMLPRDETRKIDYQKGTTWTGAELTAPYDFAILKDPDTLEAQRIRAAEAVLPHFIVDTSVSDIVYHSLVLRISRSISYDTLKSGTLSRPELVREVISQIYHHGIFAGDTDLAENDGASFGLVEGKQVRVVKSSSVLSLDEARELAVRLCTASGDTLLGVMVSEELKPDIFYDDEKTSILREHAFLDVPVKSGMIRKGDLIISKGNTIDSRKAQVLRSYFHTLGYRDEGIKNNRLTLGGQILIISLSILMLIIFLAYLRKDIFSDNRKITLLLFLIILNIGMFVSSLHYPQISQYVIPLCMLPIIIRVFFDTRLALFTHIISILILGSVAYNGFEFIFMQTIAGMVTIFSVTNLRRRVQLFVSSGLIFISYLLSYLGLSFIHEGSIEKIEWMNFVWLLGNVGLTLFAYPLIYLFEKIFGLVSDVSLMELSDTNTPLLRELSIRAPGTFQHSLQVANLAEAAIYRIGGNSLLVRVGALYHDIGKMEMPMYFIENQSGGVNPHDDLSYEESASIIISHVIKGIEKGRRHKLPELVIDFIRTHHGTTTVQYFYQSYLKNYPDKSDSEQQFKYPGPLPYSKETAVLMMADSVEAASRSLDKPDEKMIDSLVEKIIRSQVEQEQFTNSDITFRDITRIKKIFKKMLMSIYHVRVEYPES